MTSDERALPSFRPRRRAAKTTAAGLLPVKRVVRQGIKRQTGRHYCERCGHPKGRCVCPES